MIKSHALHQFVPRDAKCQAQSGRHFDGWRVLARLDHLDITAADICLFGKLLLGQCSRITQSINILSEAPVFELAHERSFMNTCKNTAKHPSLSFSTII